MSQGFNKYIQICLIINIVQMSFCSNFLGNPDHLRDCTLSLTFATKILLNLTVEIKNSKS